MVFLGCMYSCFLALIGADLVPFGKSGSVSSPLPLFMGFVAFGRDTVHSIFLLSSILAAFLGFLSTDFSCNRIYRRVSAGPMVRVCTFISTVARIRVLFPCLVKDCILHPGRACTTTGLHSTS